MKLKTRDCSHRMLFVRPNLKHTGALFMCPHLNHTSRVTKILNYKKRISHTDVDMLTKIMVPRKFLH